MVALRARQNHQVRSGEFLRCRHEINSHAAALQRREVVEIGDAWKTDHGGAQCAILGWAPGGCGVQFCRVLVLDPEVGDHRDDPGDRHTGPIGDHLRQRFQHGRVAPEAVDEDSADQFALLRFEEFEGAEQRPEDSAAVDVSDQQHGRPGVQGDPHVDDVALLEIRLGRTAGALDYYQVMLAPEPVEGDGHMRPQFGLCPVVVLCRGPSYHRAVQDDLRPPVALRLQQDRVHVGGNLYSGGGGLDRLCPSQFASAGRDPGVVRHVLGLEGRNGKAVLPENAAQRRGEHALTDRRGRTLDHQGRGTRMFLRAAGHRCVPNSPLGFEVRRLVERLEPDHAGNDFNDGHAGVAKAELGHSLGRQIEQRHNQAPERSTVTHNYYVSLRSIQVCLLDELTASFDDVRQQFAARGLERRVAVEIPACPLAVFGQQFGP